ncbi:MAG: hypothetical protein MJ185_09965 [Treponema sp.]|nr:hypothetical protein [Treponema sp.]
MKRVFGTLAALCAVSLFFSCASNKGSDAAVTEEADSYEIDVSEKSVEKTSSKEKNNKKRKNSFSLGNMFASKYQEFGEGSIYTPKTFGGRKQELVSFVVYPKTETAGFGSSYMASYYYLTMDDSSRKLLVSSMNRYLKDFEEKKLDRTNKKSFKAYGKVNAIVRWGTLKANNPYYSQDAVLTLGYKFEDNSPYFSIQMEQVPDEGSASTAKDVNDIVFSMRLNYFLTKNQCRGFIDNLTDEKVYAAYNAYEIEQYGAPEEDDIYFEEESDEVEDVE